MAEFDLWLSKAKTKIRTLISQLQTALEKSEETKHLVGKTHPLYVLRKSGSIEIFHFLKDWKNRNRIFSFMKRFVQDQIYLDHLE